MDAESYSLTEDTGCCFLVKLHLPQRCQQWEMRCSDPRGWLENIITSQLWDTNHLWLLVIHSVTIVRNLSLYYLLCGHRTRCHLHGKICFANSPSFASQLHLWSGSMAADGSKVPQPEPPPVQTLEYLSDSEMICYANHYSYLTTCGVATLVLMASHTGRLLLMLTATPSEYHTHLTDLWRDQSMEEWYRFNVCFCACYICEKGWKQWWIFSSDMLCAVLYVLLCNSNHIFSLGFCLSICAINFSCVCWLESKTLLVSKWQLCQIQLFGRNSSSEATFLYLWME